METANKIEILRTGTGWLCAEKPPGMSVHNLPGSDLLSVLEQQIQADDDLMAALGAQQGFQVQPVHRLDQETSGLILVATDPDRLRCLSNLFQQGAVKKHYIALVHGRFDPPSDAVQVWDTPLSKQAGGRSDPRGRGKRVRSETRYRVLDQSVHYALLEIELVTGRKHQIRRHAKLAGHPVTGDTRYGSKRSVDFLRENLSYDRLGLHSFKIEFTLDRMPVTINSRQIPRQMTALLDQDRP
jgi:23S rRNA-/tRNA-specific pseudouridylate synthase